MPGVVIGSVVSGIGNQLFCWATAKAVAWRAGMDLTLECSAYKHDLCGRTFVLPQLGVVDPCLLRYSSIEKVAIPVLVRVASRNNGFFRFANYSFYTDPGGRLNRKLLETNLSGRCYLRGYWQSPRYFAEFSTQLRSQIRFEPCNALHTTPEMVCVHIRSYNEERSSNRVRLAHDYYRAAYSRCYAEIANPIFVIYSDDLESAKRKSLLPDKYELGQAAHSPSCSCHDLCELITMSRFHSFIIANSTFSWWAAYLSDRRPWVQAPSRHRNGWYSQEPLPSEWDEV